MLYQWEGRSQDGKTVRGQLQAQSVTVAKAQLRHQGVTVTRLEAPSRFSGGERLRAKEVALITRQLATMLRSGLPMLESLIFITKGTTSARARTVLRHLCEDVENGLPLSEALGKQAASFDEVFCNVVKAGETSGSLASLLERLAERQEKGLVIKKRLISEMIYPGITLLIIVAVKTIFMPGVLTLTTVLSLLAATIATVCLYKGSPTWRDKILRFGLRIPVIGGILQKTALARWSRTLGTLYAAGVPVIDALETSIRVSDISIYQHALQQIHDKIAAGHSLTSALENPRVLPDIVIQMVRSGEQSGELDAMLNKVAEFFEEDVEQTIKRLFAVLLPVMIIVLGLMVFLSLQASLGAHYSVLDKL